jgi:hypothetical protein
VLTAIRSTFTVGCLSLQFKILNQQQITVIMTTQKGFTNFKKYVDIPATLGLT